MRIIICFVIAISGTGCAAFFDSQDPCQARDRGAGYQRPTFCGAGSGGTVYVTRDFRTNTIVTTTRSRP